jgi:hypothetical protein
MITITELARQCSLSPSQVVKRLLKKTSIWYGVFSSVDLETAQAIADEVGVTLTQGE